MHPQHLCCLLDQFEAARICCANQFSVLDGTSPTTITSWSASTGSLRRRHQAATTGKTDAIITGRLDADRDRGQSIGEDEMLQLARIFTKHTPPVNIQLKAGRQIRKFHAGGFRRSSGMSSDGVALATCIAEISRCSIGGSADRPAIQQTSSVMPFLRLVEHH